MDAGIYQLIIIINYVRSYFKCSEELSYHMIKGRVVVVDVAKYKEVRVYNVSRKIKLVHHNIDHLLSIRGRNQLEVCIYIRILTAMHLLLGSE